MSLKSEPVAEAGQRRSSERPGGAREGEGGGFMPAGIRWREEAPCGLSRRLCRPCALRAGIEKGASRAPFSCRIGGEGF